jgi:hypothetical protein
MRKLYVGLDVAKVMGLAWYDRVRHTATVVEVTGTPIEQFTSLGMMALQDDDIVTFGLERLHVFVNAATIRNMSERQGFLKWTLITMGYTPKEVGPSEARALWSVKGKAGAPLMLNPFAGPMMLTTNHADALLVALFLAHRDDPTLVLYGLKITVLEGINYEQQQRAAARAARLAQK